jgi:hypothetical protein
MRHVSIRTVFVGFAHQAAAERAMTARRQRIAIEPYNLTFAQVAEAVFVRSENWLRMNALARPVWVPRPPQ